MPNKPKEEKSNKTTPRQEQDSPPEHEEPMHPDPQYVGEIYKPAGKLKGKTAIITGVDSGIGRSVAVLFAKEGANVVVAYLEESEDAETAQKKVESLGQKCLLIKGDVGQESHCLDIVAQTVNEFGRLDILVNNAAEQHPQESISDISEKQLEGTFRTNIFSQFFMVKAAMPHIKPGSTIINTASVTAYRGSPFTFGL